MSIHCRDHFSALNFSIGDDRFLIVYKKTVTPFVPTNQNTIRLELTDESYEKIDQLLQVDPVTEAERQNTILRPNDDSKSQAHLPFMFGDFQSKTKVTVPPANKDTAQRFTEVRQSLPIFEHRAKILTAINQHQVVVISGETGKRWLQKSNLEKLFLSNLFDCHCHVCVICFKVLGKPPRCHSI